MNKVTKKINSKFSFTLIEMTISISILALILATVIVIIHQAINIYARGIRQTQAANEASLACQWLSRDIQDAYFLHEATAQSIAFESKDLGYIRYYLDSNR